MISRNVSKSSGKVRHLYSVDAFTLGVVVGMVIIVIRSVFTGFKVMNFRGFVCGRNATSTGSFSYETDLLAQFLCLCLIFSYQVLRPPSDEYTNEMIHGV